VTLWNRSYIFPGKIKLPIVEQIIPDAIQYDSYSTGEEIIKCCKPAFYGSVQLTQPNLYATIGLTNLILYIASLITTVHVIPAPYQVRDKLQRESREIQDSGSSPE
jgi:hypothetical protein